MAALSILFKKNSKCVEFVLGMLVSPGLYPLYRTLTKVHEHTTDEQSRKVIVFIHSTLEPKSIIIGVEPIWIISFLER